MYPQDSYRCLDNALSGLIIANRLWLRALLTAVSLVRPIKAVELAVADVFVADAVSVVTTELRLRAIPSGRSCNNCISITCSLTTL